MESDINTHDICAEKVKEFKEHPALKFANDAIVLAAVRTGTKGYTGDENLSDWLRKTLTEVAEAARAAEQNRIYEEGWKIIDLNKNPKNNWGGLVPVNNTINAILMLLDKVKEPMAAHTPPETTRHEAYKKGAAEKTEQIIAHIDKYRTKKGGAVDVALRQMQEEIRALTTLEESEDYKQ